MTCRKNKEFQIWGTCPSQELLRKENPFLSLKNRPLNGFCAWNVTACENISVYWKFDPKLIQKKISSEKRNSRRESGRKLYSYN